jgi:coproporphyrinogen III oxidase-like Fe-S oxidoreductase
MESLMIKELKRKLTIRKEKYRKDLSYVGRIFDVKEDEYLRRYDSIGDEMISVGVELEILQRKMSDLDLEFEKLKKGLLLNENIDLRNSIEKFGSEGKNVVDMLFKGGFISSDECQILIDDIWNNRYRKSFSD